MRAGPKPSCDCHLKRELTRHISWHWRWHSLPVIKQKVCLWLPWGWCGHWGHFMILHTSLFLMWICLEQAWEQEPWHSWFHVFFVAETILLCYFPQDLSAPYLHSTQSCPAQRCIHSCTHRSLLYSSFCIPSFLHTSVLLHRSYDLQDREDVLCSETMGEEAPNNKAHNTFYDVKAEQIQTMAA